MLSSNIEVFKIRKNYNINLFINLYYFIRTVIAKYIIYIKYYNRKKIMINLLISTID